MSVVQAIHIVGISGSLRPMSFTRLAVQTALRGAEQVGAQSRMLDLNDYGLEFSDVTLPPSPCAYQGGHQQLHTQGQP